MLLQDEAPNFLKSLAARLLMPVTEAADSVKLASVLWADDKSKPYKNMYGDCPWRWCASSPSMSEKPKTAIMVTHLDENGFTGSLMPTDFFARIRK